MLVFEPFSNNIWFADCDGRLNRAALHEMDKDAKDKHHAEHIDDRMYQLRNGSIGIGYFPGIENVDNTLVSLMYNTFYNSQQLNHISHGLRMAIKMTCIDIHTILQRYRSKF